MKILFLFLLFQVINATAFSQHRIRMVAEWEPAYGTLIRWPLGIPSSLAIELAADDSLFVLVESQAQQNQAVTTFTSWGVNLNHCVFIYASTYSHWTRDWGPHYIFDQNGTGGIADPMFDGYPWVPGCESTQKQPNAQLGVINPSYYSTRGWEEDDMVNSVLASLFNCPLITMPVFLTGGNIMTDGQGIAFSTEQMLAESAPFCDEECFRENAHSSLGIIDYHILSNPEVYGIQHIDCYAKLLDEETILVKEVPQWHIEYGCIEQLVAELSQLTTCYQRPYDIKRIFCGSYNGDEVAAYTNSLIINKKVLVPLFGISSDEQALAVYQQAMPGYQVIGFEYGSWYYYDALHCRTMGIFDRHMLILHHKPIMGNVTIDTDYEIIAYIDDRSEAGLVPEALKLFWRQHPELTWNETLLIPAYGADTFAVTIPWHPAGTTVEYYLSAADFTGRFETLPRTAPASYYQFTITDTLTWKAEIDVHKKTILKVFPTLFSHNLNISYRLPDGISGQIEIINAIGLPVRRFQINSVSSEGMLLWDGKDASGCPCPSGMYQVVLYTPHSVRTSKCILKSIQP